MWIKTLVADTDEKNASRISDILFEYGCEAQVAKDAKEAVVKTLNFNPSFILVDEKMPGMTGLADFAGFRQAAGTGGIKVIAMVETGSGGNITEVEKTGFDGYLSKPVTAESLWKFIENFRKKNGSKEARPKILCVDDEPLNLELLEAILIPAGYDVNSARNGHEALTALKSDDTDLVLLDVMMPGMNGYEVCALIKASALTGRIPVIMITALSAKEDRIKSIEAGAEDFVTKPFDKTEVLTRIKQLLVVSEQNSRLASLFAVLSGITDRGNKSAQLLSYGKFDFIAEVDALVKNTTSGRADGHSGILLGTKETGWKNYSMTDPEAFAEGAVINDESLGFLLERQVRILYVNKEESSSNEAQLAAFAFAKDGIKAGNFICRAGGGICLAAYGYKKSVGDRDAVVLNAMAMQIMFLRSVAMEIKETEKAFDYLVYTLARAAEANDEDTGMHILRVGEYAALLAQKMGMDTGFVERIRLQAQLHDVGKIHIPIAILRKPGVLTAEEFEIIKMHTVYGAKIIGMHERLGMGNSVALCHHEKWDGSGYPKGLMGTNIPLEARITAIADQYDALRNARAYKPAFSHEKTFGIIMKGDGRTKPEHFDPEILAVFENNEKAFEEIYTKING